MNPIVYCKDAVLKVFEENGAELLMVAGLGCGAAAVGVGIYQGPKVKESIDNFKSNAEAYKVAKEATYAEWTPEGKTEPCDEVKDAVNKEYAKSILKEASGTAKEVAKELAPVIALEVGMVGFCLWSNRLQAAKIDKLSKDLAGVTAAYTVLDKLYRKYRENVRTEYGEEADDKMRRGVIIEDEKGNKKVVLPEELNEENKKAWADDCKSGNQVLGWSVIWDTTAGPAYPMMRNENLYGWTPDYKRAWTTLCTLEADMRKEIAKPHGYCVVNDVYKRLGYDKFCSQSGAVVGWYNDTDRWLSEEEVNAIFDLGLTSKQNVEARKGNEEGWWINLEPMGVVLEHINCKN